MSRSRRSHAVRVAASLSALLCCAPAFAGTLDLFGVEAEYKLTLGYATAMRMRDPAQPLINGAMDQMQVKYSPTLAATNPQTLGLESLAHPGLRESTNFDDGNRDFKKGALLNNRVSGYGELQLKFDSFGLGDIGFVGSGAAHYDQVFHDTNDHTNPNSVNRMGVRDIDPGGNGAWERYGPIDEWTDDAVETNGTRKRLLEAYAYGQWYLTDEIGLSVRLGKHLAAWGESLFFPGIVSAQGPFDATKANVPGAEVKEILLPVNQVSMQMSLTQDLTMMAYKQFEYGETEIFPEGDFFSPADLIGPGASFGYGSINPVHPNHCTISDELSVEETDTGTFLPPGDTTLCTVGQGMSDKPEYIMTVRTPDKLPSKDDEDHQYGVGLKYANIIPDTTIGAYYIKYNNHNPGVQLNMGYAFVGNLNSTGQPVTTQNFNSLKVPTSYTVTYANDIEMKAISFSTVFWVFNIGGEIIRRENVDTSLAAVISGVKAPVATRGDTTTVQMSFLYVNNPDFMMFDEVVVVGEVGYTKVDRTDRRRNEDGICMVGTDPADCTNGKTPSTAYTEFGNTLFYDDHASAGQVLILPKGRNVFAGWDIGTPMSFAVLQGNPSTPGVFGALYGDGDTRWSAGVTGQYLQNLEISLAYNGFLGDANKHINGSTLKANPYVDHDYLAFSVKYNL